METTELQPAAARYPCHIEGERLGVEITALCGRLYAATYRLLVLIREFDEKQYWELAGHHSCAHWLHFQCGIGLNAAREKVRVAHALAGLPKMSTAFSRGELSYSKVRAMTRIADADSEDFLLTAARHGTAADVEQLVSQSRRGQREEEDELANGQYRNRSVTVRYEPDGAMVLQARLPAEQGALVMKALDLARERSWTAGDGEASAERDVSAEMQREPFHVRQAGALVDLAETYLNSGQMSGSSADRYQVVVHVSAETLQKKAANAGDSPHRDGDRSHLEDGPRVSAETSRRIACDASRIPIFEDEEGEPLSIGRRTRAIPPSIKRALEARDDGCRFPGCTHKRFVDGHHIRHWANGGETSLDNLVLLCRRHHRLVHEGGFSCERLPGGKLVFRDPGRREVPCRPGLLFNNSDPAATRH